MQAIRTHCGLKLIGFVLFLSKVALPPATLTDPQIAPSVNREPQQPRFISGCTSCTPPKKLDQKLYGTDIDSASPPGPLLRRFHALGEVRPIVFGAYGEVSEGMEVLIGDQ
jgi:hypothetical protein